MNRNMLTTVLAVLFAIGAIVSALMHRWLDAALAAAPAALALVIVYRRRSRAN